MVADGESLVRAGFRLLLEATGSVSVVGEAANGEEAVALARQLRPDVALVDVTLPGLDSVEATVRFAESMTWNGKHPLVQLITRSYQKGVRLSAKEMKELEKQIERLPGLEKWFVDIPPGTS